MDVSEKKTSISKRAGWAYMFALGIPIIVLIFSYSQGANWKPVLVGLPVYSVIIGSITYQLIKELRALKQEEQEAARSEKNEEQ